MHHKWSTLGKTRVSFSVATKDYSTRLRLSIETTSCSDFLDLGPVVLSQRVRIDSSGKCFDRSQKSSTWQVPTREGRFQLSIFKDFSNIFYLTHTSKMSFQHMINVKKLMRHCTFSILPPKFGVHFILRTLLFWWVFVFSFSKQTLLGTQRRNTSKSFPSWLAREHYFHTKKKLKD